VRLVGEGRKVLQSVAKREFITYVHQDCQNLCTYVISLSQGKCLCVARKLREVNKLLVAYGMTVVVLDGFRPIEVQAELWNWMLLQAQALFPPGGSAQWEAYALRYASNPTNFKADHPNTWPTHSTGAAIDLTLEEIASGKRAYMGGIYLDSSPVSVTRYYEELKIVDSASQSEARRNRRLLFWAMSAVGFINYAFEWWHYDYLTQASVMNQGLPAGLKAHYGLANGGNSPESHR
jgi:D-alanyl-D-alanine dipeptidase